MRITIKILENQIAQLNKMLNRPCNPWATKDGKNTASIGNFHLSQAYGGCSLHETVTEGGGVRDVFSCGHMPKRELSGRILAMLEGIDYTNGNR